MKTFAIVLSLISLFFLMSCSNSGKSDKITINGNFESLIQPVDRESLYGEDGYYVWGGSVVKSDDGLYHMFYSRWKEEYGFEAWVTHSEIAHAVADNPTGPYKFKDVALPVRGAEFWDGLCTHNPTIHKFKDKYYLYYMGNTGDGVNMQNLNFVHRNNQRIGGAWADYPNGPWHRLDEPVIDISSDDQADDALMTSNPSITKMRDGKYLMIYKAVAKQHELPFGGPVTHLAAISDNPLGPFKKYDQRIFYKDGHKFPAEDPYIWFQKNEDKYYAVVKDNHGTFTNKGCSLAFFESANGLDWEVSANPLVTDLSIKWNDGEVQKVSRLERPQVLFVDGLATALYCAVAFEDVRQRLTKNVHFPLGKENN